MKKLRIVMLPIVILAITGAAYLLWRNHQPESGLTLSGNIEVTDSTVAFQTAGRLAERLADEGMEVQQGEVLARLDSTELAHQVALAEANLQAVQAQLKLLEAGSRPEEIGQARAQLSQATARLEELQHGSRPQDIQQAQAAVDQAQAQLDNAKAQAALRESELKRQEQLYQAGVVPAQQYDQVATACETARTQVAAAEQGVAAARERLSLAQEGPRSEQVDQARAGMQAAASMYQLALNGPRAETVEQARAQVAAAQQQLELARTKLGYCAAVCPLTGVVLTEAAEPGEYLQPGSPVLTVADLDHPWLRAYINESDLGRVKLGQAVHVTVDSFPGQAFDGHVTFIASEAEFTPKQVQTHEERVKLVYRVKIEIDNQEHELRPGMPADAHIDLDGAGRD
jgi:HlyD family secretion protein